MIKINLIVKKKELGKFSRLGLDFSKLKVKFVLLSVIIFYASSALLNGYIKGVESKKDNELAALNKKMQTLMKEISRNKEVEKKIEKIVSQEKMLHEKKEIIEVRVKERKNPSKIMIYLSKNIPEDVWIKKLTLKNDQIHMECVTSTYNSINTFVENLKSSIYFNKSFKLSSVKTEVNKKTGKRTESFNISGEIERYN